MIIAEIGSVHNGSIVLAKKLILKAKLAGADIVKFQMHIAEEESLIDAPSPEYFRKERRYDYFKRLEFSFDQGLNIKNFCEKNGLEFLCSPFSLKAVEILEKLKVKRYKIASGEVTNHPLLEKIKKTKKQVFLSTGMSNWKEIEMAYNILKNNKLVIFQCTSNYPCELKDVGSNVFFEIKKRFPKSQLGFSDHTKGISASLYAASLGIDYIEKHFTLTNKMYGSDAKNALEYDKFKFLVEQIKDIVQIRKSKKNKNNLSSLKKMKLIFEKSIVYNKDLLQGHKISINDLEYKKPGDGISPIYYKKFLGKILKKRVSKNQKLSIKNFL